MKWSVSKGGSLFVIRCVLFDWQMTLEVFGHQKEKMSREQADEMLIKILDDTTMKVEGSIRS